MSIIKETSIIEGLSHDTNSSSSSASSTPSLTCLSLSKHGYPTVFFPSNEENTRSCDIEVKTCRQRASSTSSAHPKTVFKGLSFGKEIGTSKYKLFNVSSNNNTVTDTPAPVLPTSLNISSPTKEVSFNVSPESSSSKNHFFKSLKKEGHSVGTGHASPKSFFSHSHLHAFGNSISSSVSNMFHPLQKSFSSLDVKHTDSTDISVNQIINDVWPLFCMKTLPLFSGEGLMVPVEYLNKLVRLHVKKRYAEKKMGLFIDELYEFIEKGMRSFDVNLSSLPDEKMIHRFVELWTFFFTTILPYIEAVFLPLQAEFNDLEWTTYSHGKDVLKNQTDLDVKRITLIRFRDDIVLPIYERLKVIFTKIPLNLDLSQEFMDIASKLLQSILILTSVHSLDEKQKKIDNLAKILCHNWFKSERVGRDRRGFVAIKCESDFEKNVS